MANPYKLILYYNEDIQINQLAIDGIELRLKNIVEHYAAMAEDREFKRVTPMRMQRLFQNENRF